VILFTMGIGRGTKSIISQLSASFRPASTKACFRSFGVTVGRCLVLGFIEVATKPGNKAGHLGLRALHRRANFRVFDVIFFPWLSYGSGVLLGCLSPLCVWSNDFESYNVSCIVGFRIVSCIVSNC
jgi:hypothetical protein